MITYSTARADELSELAEFWRRTSRWHESWPSAPPVDVLVPKFQPSSGTASTVVARDARGTVVGVATLRVADNGLAAPPGSVFGSNLLVHPHHRGGPVAGGLMDQVFARAVALGAEGIIALVDPTNEVAERLYRYYGFRDGTPASAECCYLELVSRWPQVARYLVEAIGPHLPAWPDPSLAGLRRGFRPRGRPTDDGVARDGIDIYRAEVPAWHRPAIEVHVDRATGTVVALEGALIRATTARAAAGRSVEVLNAAPGPLRLAIAIGDEAPPPTCVDPGEAVVAEVGPGARVVVEVHHPDGEVLARFPLVASRPAAERNEDPEIESGPLRARVSASDGVVRVSGPDGRALVDLQWPEAGDITPLVARRGLVGEVEVRHLPGGAVRATAPLDRWRRALLAAGLPAPRTSDSPDGPRPLLHRTVRPVAEGLEVEVEVEVPEGVAAPDGPLRLVWWWRLQEGVATSDVGGFEHRWSFAPHGLPDAVARELLPAATHPPAGGPAPSGALRWQAHDLEVDIEWTAPGAAASWSQRSLPALDVDLAGLGPGRHRVAGSVLRARGRPATPTRGQPAVVGGGVELDVDDAGVVTASSGDHAWIPAWDPAVPVRPTRRTPTGLVPVVAVGPWRWSVEGGVDPEEWRVEVLDVHRCGDRLQRASTRWRRVDETGAAAALAAEMTVSRGATGWQVQVRGHGEADGSGLLTVGLAAVVQPPGPATVAVDTTSGRVCIDAAASSGHLRLLGRDALAIASGGDGVALRGDPGSAVAAWPVDGPHRHARCPVLLTRRVEPGEVVTVHVGGTS